MPGIALRGASKTYRVGDEMVTALDDVTFDVARGEMACVYGASGSGKTTLVNVLCGIDTADSGDVVVDGVSLSGLSEGRRADLRLTKIGVVFQSNNLLPEFDALENVALPLLVRGLSQAGANRAALAALDSVGMADLRSRRPGRMSGGQRQRVGIARALAGDRVLLVADEPTGALDSRNSAELFTLLRELCKVREAAVVVATHDPLARGFADSVYTMVDGTMGAATMGKQAATAVL